MTGDAVVVTGLGLVTPAGIGVKTSWDRVCRGVPTAARDPEIEGLPVDFSCRVPDFDSCLSAIGRQPWRLDRYTQFALAAAQEAIQDAGLEPEDWDRPRVGVVVGTAAGGVGTFEREHKRLLGKGHALLSPALMPMFLPNMAAGQLAIAFHATGPNLSASTACASGATAIGLALSLLRAGSCDIVLAGGAEAMITPLCTAAFAKMGALSRRRDDPERASRPFDSARDGFVMGEGAAILVLERYGHAQSRGALPRAVLAGYGASADAHHAVAPHPDGRGAELALRRALGDAGAAPEEVGHVNAHGTSTTLNDLTESAAIARVMGPAAPAVTSTKGVTGHTLGAAGAIEAAFTVLSVQNGLIPPTANVQSVDPAIELDVVTGAARPAQLQLALSNSFGFGGHNVVLAFGTADCLSGGT